MNEIVRAALNLKRKVNCDDGKALVHNYACLVTRKLAVSSVCFFCTKGSMNTYPGFFRQIFILVSFPFHSKKKINVTQSNKIVANNIRTVVALRALQFNRITPGYSPSLAITRQLFEFVFRQTKFTPIIILSIDLAGFAAADKIALSSRF